VKGEIRWLDWQKQYGTLLLHNHHFAHLLPEYQASEISFSMKHDDELVGGIVTSPLDDIEPYSFFAQHMEGAACLSVVV